LSADNRPAILFGHAANDSMKIAQPFKAGNNATQITKSSQGRQNLVAVRQHLSSLTGLGTFPNREPSHKWLGYFQRQTNARTTKPRPARQSIRFPATRKRRAGVWP
jgi:hypothetical protein